MDPTTNPRIRLGLCCLNTTLRAQKPSIFASRGITLKKAMELDMSEIQRRALENLDDLYKMIEWNEQHFIKVFRFSSEIFPHLSNPILGELLGVPIPYDLEFAREKLQKLGALAKQYGHRITFHPGQLFTESPVDLRARPRSQKSLIQRPERGGGRGHGCWAFGGHRFGSMLHPT